MTRYRLSIEDRGYDKFHFGCTETGSEVDLPVVPYLSMLFDGDVIEAGTSGGFSVVESKVRDADELPGVLVLDDRCRYGKEKDRFLYKCVPDDPALPYFLVPRKEPTGSFSNKRDNLFVLFRFNSWPGGGGYPRASLVRTIGPVSRSECYYEYQVVRKGLHYPISQLARKAVAAAKSGVVPICDQDIDDRTAREVFTIDTQSVMKPNWTHDPSVSSRSHATTEFFMSRSNIRT